MNVLADVKNGDVHEVEVSEDAVYAEVLDALDLNPEAAVVMVDGRPVPEDAPVEAEEVVVMRTLSGG